MLRTLGGYFSTKKKLRIKSKVKVELCSIYVDYSTKKERTSKLLELEFS